MTLLGDGVVVLLVLGLLELLESLPQQAAMMIMKNTIAISVPIILVAIVNYIMLIILILCDYFGEFHVYSKCCRFESTFNKSIWFNV